MPLDARRTATRVALETVSYNVIDGVAIFEGDIALGTPEEMDSMVHAVENESADAVRGVAMAASPGEIVHGVGIPGLRFRWPGGLLPYTVVPALRNTVNQAIAHFQANTRIRFVERTSANSAQFPNFVAFEQLDGCWSQVGMQGGRQVISLGAGCETMGIAVHEICHALGLWHEQSREDRDRNVRIVWANIQSGREHNFNQHIADGDDIGAYEFGSIMHYGRRAFSRNNQDTIVPLGGQGIGQRNGLSPGDIAAIRAMYPELESSQSWRGTQFNGTLAPSQTQTWFTHSWPSHWFVVWNVVPMAPAIDGPAQLDLTVRLSRQADRADTRLVKYHLAVRNLTGNTVSFQTRYEVLGWHSSFV
ncbi:M12 family metallopeptidase [Cupriavidus necator]|uniref:M12 family metallopeptidase n=1 Tax=Cupriavidus necator TaxID=106590 RepID=UPI0039C0A1D9